MNEIECAVTRSGRIESIHRAVAAIVTPTGEVYNAFGDIDLQTYVRSSAKPFQAMAVLRSGARDKFVFTDEEMALICASHNAEPIHTDLARDILTKLELDESAYDCGAHPPIDKASANDLIRQGVEPTPIHNNCSGKHAGMLATALTLGVPTDGYLSQDHPVQQLIHEIVCESTDETEIFRGIDGCSAPVFYMPVNKLALAFARLAAQDTPERETIFRVMNAHPYLVAGRKRWDTEVMQQFPGTLVSKGGGEAVYGAGIKIDDRVYGLAVKVLDGHHRTLGAIVIALLNRIGMIDDAQREALKWFWQPELKNVAGRVTGSYDINLPMT